MNWRISGLAIKLPAQVWQDIWLNEGFATHLASMDMENKYPLTVRVQENRKLTNILQLLMDQYL